jgi:hypothetical protein
MTQVFECSKSTIIDNCTSLWSGQKFFDLFVVFFSLKSGYQSRISRRWLRNCRTLYHRYKSGSFSDWILNFIQKIFHVNYQKKTVLRSVNDENSFSILFDQLFYHLEYELLSDNDFKKKLDFSAQDSKAYEWLVRNTEENCLETNFIYFSVFFSSPQQLFLDVARQLCWWCHNNVFHSFYEL